MAEIQGHRGGYALNIDDLEHFELMLHFISKLQEDKGLVAIQFPWNSLTCIGPNK